MEPIEMTALELVDRTDWPPGAWDNEPDFRYWQYRGLECYMVRNHLGAWCGYVVVPRFHPLRRLGYDQANVSVDTHGGLTFSDYEKREGIVDLLPSVKSKRWVLGFDCLHAFDEAPGMLAVEIRHKILMPHIGTYRTTAYAQAETQNLADQINRTKYKFWTRW